MTGIIMHIQKTNVTNTGYFLTLLSDDRTTVVDGQVNHNGNAQMERQLLTQANELLVKALRIGVEGIRNEK
jgi:hypothetical protein